MDIYEMRANEAKKNSVKASKKTIRSRITACYGYFARKIKGATNGLVEDVRGRQYIPSGRGWRRVIEGFDGTRRKWRTRCFNNKMARRKARHDAKKCA